MTVFTLTVSTFTMLSPFLPYLSQPPQSSKWTHGPTAGCLFSWIQHLFPWDRYCIMHNGCWRSLWLTLLCQCCGSLCYTTLDSVANSGGESPCVEAPSCLHLSDLHRPAAVSTIKGHFVLRWLEHCLIFICFFLLVNGACNVADMVDLRILVI